MTPWDEQTISIRRGDLEKLRDVLAGARDFLLLRDQMNAAIHCDAPRYSSLTTVVATAYDRTQELLKPI